ncbi:uncharacterized protein LOC129601194 isoform X2 [Paramacrobiotus metropolitanus]|uniref:uncharacterized protein LOC129601194 isoform X2 n=1 Tax=Paramacrobiotus metropolitanus TaxID=2943436 RepID=UPI002445CB74|nr:uncharacterized protein LOC129601194 isoform X2 [Paramacrobiotus metropolitanus]
MVLRVCLTACLVIVATSSQRAVPPSLLMVPNNCTTEEQTAAQQCPHSIDTLLLKNSDMVQKLETVFGGKPRGNPNATTMSRVVEFLCGPVTTAISCIERLPRPCFFHPDLPTSMRWILFNSRIAINVSDIFRRMCGVPDLDQHLIRIGECTPALNNLTIVQSGGIREEISRAAGPPPQLTAPYMDFDWECRAIRRHMEIMNRDLVTSTCGEDAAYSWQ